MHIKIYKKILTATTTFKKNQKSILNYKFITKFTSYMNKKIFISFINCSFYSYNFTNLNSNLFLIKFNLLFIFFSKSLICLTSIWYTSLSLSS